MIQVQVPLHNSALSSHPGLTDIYLLVCSGWPAHRVADFVSRKHQVPVKASDVHAYAQELPDNHFLELQTIIERAREGNFVVDVQAEMAEMLLLMRQRIKAAVLIEEMRPSATLNTMLRTYFDMLVKYLQALKMLDFLPAEGARPPTELEAASRPTLQSLLKERNDNDDSQPAAALPPPKLQ